ncbi:MAG: inositol monophosphatase family protein, partial [Aeromicrobium sp.]
LLPAGAELVVFDGLRDIPPFDEEDREARSAPEPVEAFRAALRDADGVLLGAVHQPVGGETWVGGRGLPTSLDGKPVAPLEDRSLAECSLATYIHPATLGDPDVLQSWLALVAGVATPRVFGSGSMDLCGVATGRVGVWAQHSTPAWDWLPGQALVEAAGGRTAVVEHRGHRWHLAGNPQALGELVERLQAS